MSEADVVIDASGRSSRLPHWLSELGYPTSEPRAIDAHFGYACRVYRANGVVPIDIETIEAGSVEEKLRARLVTNAFRYSRGVVEDIKISWKPGTRRKRSATCGREARTKGCPLWVKSRHKSGAARLPLCANSGPSRGAELTILLTK